MYNITIIDPDGDEFEIEQIESYTLIGGGLQVYCVDGSISLYAQGSWAEADLKPIVDESMPKEFQNRRFQG